MAVARADGARCPWSRERLGRLARSGRAARTGSRGRPRGHARTIRQRRPAGLRWHRRHRHRPGAVIVTDYDDLDLDSNATHPMLSAPPPRPSWVGPALLLVVFLLLLGGFWWYRSHRGNPATPVRVAGRGAATATPTPPPASSAVTNLPPLGELDPFIRSTVGSLTQMSAAEAWLATDHLAEQFTAIVQGVAEGKAPSRMLARFRPATPFAVTQRGGQAVIDPRSFARFDGIADTVTSLDAAASARAYRTLAPR